MIHGTLQWAADSVKGKILCGNPTTSFTGVSTDTRVLKLQELFFCLVGNSDGHHHAAAALSQGAAGVVIDERHPEVAKKISSHGTVLQVPDTLRALGDLAQSWRRKFSIPLVAIGGSNGKTTTKNLTRNVLGGKWKVLSTEANFNNLIGLPWMLFRLGPEHQVAILELGMNDFGELARLTEIAEPTAALITNIGLEHLEKLKDLEGVARAEGELFAGLSSEATALVNAADPYVARMKTAAQPVFYGTPETPIWGKILRSELSGDSPLHLEVHVDDERAELNLKLPGPHNLSNVLASLAIARHLGLPLNEAKKGLEEFIASSSRMELVELSQGIRLIDDCYNANPSSTIASLHTLARIRNKGGDKGKTFAILGEMLELGDYSVQGHREVGQAAAGEKIDYLMAIGPHGPVLLKGAVESGMAPETLQSFSDAEEAIRHLKKLPDDVGWILVKGSRGAHLEKIVQYLKDTF